jgi:hypothetical protein
MVMPIYIEMEFTKPNLCSMRAWNRLLKEAHQRQGRYWRDVLLPRHFKPDAKGKYHHQPRSAQYIRRKIKAAQIGKCLEGGMTDNVYTGTLRDLFSKTGVITATPTRVRIALKGPRYIGMIPDKSNQPNKAKEILTVADDEVQTLRDIVMDTVADGLDSRAQEEFFGPPRKITVDEGVIAHFHD